METPKIELDANEIISEVQGEELDQQVEAETTAAESSPAEDNAEVETEEEVPSEGEETDDESDESDESEESEETETDQPKRSAAGRKAELSKDIRSLAAERASLKDEVASLTQQVKGYQPLTAQQLLEADETGELTPEMAEIRAMQQRSELDGFNNQVTNVETTVRTEALQVMHDFPMFDEKSENFNKRVSDIADSVYEQVAGIKTDPQTGLRYEVAVTPYQVYESIAQAYQAGASSSQVKAQRSAERMLAAADTPTSSAPKQAKEDPFLKGFKLGN